MTTLVDDLRRQAEELRETHISWVFLHEREVYKIKKPVDFGFLDFTTLERRRTACEAEVELNRRLSPDVYLGVVPVTRGSDGTHRLGGDGEVVDHAVHMRRLPDADRGDLRLDTGQLHDTHVVAAARRIAEFHRVCVEDAHTRQLGTPEAIGVNVRENFQQTRETVGAYLSDAEASEIEDWQLRFLEERADLFEARIAGGRVRDGHGDLRLEHLYFCGGEPLILDCIEFNERFRYGDVCSDVAFLSMDLAFHGRVDLAERLLAIYAQTSNDFDLYSLVDFYESYRAYVRGKIAAMVAQSASDEPTRRKASAQARRYFVLALAAERKPVIPPSVIAVGGIIASGKSTVSDRLTAVMGAPAINTDWTRKYMVGAMPTTKLYDSSWQGAYDPKFTEQVYDEVYRRAEVVVRSGRPVILDASFRSRDMRRRARNLATRLGVPFRFVECTADPEVCRSRLRERARGASVSDGRLEIFDDFLAKWQRVDELPADEVVQLDTGRPLDDNVDFLRARLPAWPEGLTA